jgi:hypothetical protein
MPMERLISLSLWAVWRPMEHRWYQDQGKIGPVLVGGLNLDQDVAGGASQTKAITDFFEEVADRAPIPIVIYNFPNLLSGLDVNSDMFKPCSYSGSLSNSSTGQFDRGDIGVGGKFFQHILERLPE